MVRRSCFDKLSSSGVHIHYLGGETADVGDVVRTIAVNGTMTARWPENKVVSNEKIQAGCDRRIGIIWASHMKPRIIAVLVAMELTSARHDALHHFYAEKYRESYDNNLPPEVVYIGRHRLTDTLPGTSHNIGELLLSPTRTYAPVLKQILEENYDKVHGLIHSSGGGQTKCMKYMPGNFKVIKDNLFEAPPVFTMIRENSGNNNREMYEVFNMGCRMEIYCREKDAASMITTAKHFGIDAQIIGRVESNVKKALEIRVGEELIVY